MSLLLLYEYIWALMGIAITGALHMAASTSSGFVEPVKDPTSDLVQICKRGSSVLREFRNERDRIRAVRDKLSAASSFLGKLRFSEGDDEDLEDPFAVNNALSSSRFSDAFTDDSSDAVSDTPTKSSMSSDHDDDRSTLPFASCRKDFLQLIAENSVIVLVGETGSGKTTQIGQYLLEAGYGSSGCVCITQPRRVAAVSVARRVAGEMRCKIGTTVGYSIRFEDVSSSATKLRFVTDGILLRESVQDPLLERYSCVVLDEAHERSINTDVLFGILRTVLARRVDIKVIITSATLDAERFSSFFGQCPIFRIPGRTYPVIMHYAKSSVEDYVDAAVNQVLQIHLSRPADGDILVFMTGQEDVEITCYLLMERAAKLAQSMKQKLTVLPIYSMLAPELQTKIFSKTNSAIERKAIIATNIAETSLTVPGVKYVVDCGFAKFKIYNARIGMDALQVYPISQAQAQQRAGRAGRTSPGECFRLYTQSQFEHEMLLNPVPELQRSNLSNVCLMLHGLGVSDMSKFAYLDPPPANAISESEELLRRLKAINELGKLTSRGSVMAMLPLDPTLTSCLLAAVQCGCVREMVIIIAMLSVPRVYVRPPERVQEADQRREKFSVPESDHLTLLNVFLQWESHGRAVSFSSAKKRRTATPPHQKQPESLHS